jgi:hypothetical protein
VPFRGDPMSFATALLIVLLVASWGDESPTLRALFAPRHAPPGVYQAFVSARTIEDAVERAKRQRTSWPAGAWTIERLDPIDAPYDRYRLAWLFGGARPRVARGPLVEDGRTTGSVTLISPYPDIDFRTLQPGTLALVYRRKATAASLDRPPRR